MVDSPREIIGAVLKYMGASYNTTCIDSQVVGGKQAVLEQLESLVRQVRNISAKRKGNIFKLKNVLAHEMPFVQVRVFDSEQYLKAFRAGDVWVAVGWSSDILPVAKTMSNVSVIVPKSGSSLWADLWVCMQLQLSHRF